MKRTIFALVAVLAVMAACFETAALGEGRPQPIVYTYYRQSGWGDSVQIGYVDEKGGLWLAKGSDSALYFPFKGEEQLAWLCSGAGPQRIGELSHDALSAIKSLVLSVEDQGSRSHGVACDAGTEASYAVRTDREGRTERILLGMSGDDCFENTDTNAQALYSLLRRLFPDVICYGAPMGPAGFQSVPVMVFCAFGEVDLAGAAVGKVYSDCEEGLIRQETGEAEREQILALVTRGTVTGKVNALAVTGGTTVYTLYSPEGECLGSIELYQGLLVRPDGMYAVAVR